jgi:hypothetical protein
MKDEKEIQTAWKIWILINRLNDLLWERYEKDFPDIDPYEQQDPCLGPLGSLDFMEAQDKKEG